MSFLIKNKKNNQINFDKSIKIIKKMLSKKDFSRAILGCDEILQKEEEVFLGKDKVLDKDYFELFNKRKKILENLKYKINIEILKRDSTKLVNEIKVKIKNKQYKTIKDDLDLLKTNYIDKYKDFSYLKIFYNSSKKKVDKLIDLVNTKKVYDFNDLLKKLNLLKYLGEYDKAEKGIEEIKEKEKKVLDSYKDDHFVSRRKVRRMESKYNKKIRKLDDILKKIFILKNKEIQRRKEEEKKKLFSEIKGELNQMMRKEDLINSKSYIETKIKSVKDDVFIVDFLNNKLNEVSTKIRKKRNIDSKNKNIIDETTNLLNSMGEKVLDNYINVDEKLAKNYIFIYIDKLRKKINILKDKLTTKSHKKVVKELNLLIKGSGEKLDNDKLSNLNQMYHDGMSKTLSGVNINGYDFYGKIIGADMVTGDTFIIDEKEDNYWFALGDATGHGIKAGFTVSSFTKTFLELSKDYDKINYFAMELNNSLKTAVKAGNFITSILFDVNKKEPSKVKLIGMGHEPMFIYRKKTNNIESFRPMGLAAGIRKITKIDSIKMYDFNFDNGDIFISYTDGIIEAKNSKGDMYGINRFKEKFLEACHKGLGVHQIYDYIFDDLKYFSQKTSYDDDVTIIVVRRNIDKELITKESNIHDIVKNVDKNLDTAKENYRGKTREQILKKAEEERIKRELDTVTLKLHNLYKDGEILKLKYEAFKYIKKGYVSKKINNFLKKSLDMEEAYKIGIKEKKVQAKYDTLLNLYAKGDYKTVIKDAYDIIVKNGNI